MCGITGFTGEKNPNLLTKMADQIRHRGPDDAGYYIDHQVNLANRRLAVIDIAGGNQPICNETESIWVVYNGEIYNHLELKQSLEAKGHHYKTHCDTETLVHLYEAYGDQFASHLNGIFSFALWDKAQQKLILGRDYFGIKPLHYSISQQQLIFGSEIKAILMHPAITKQLNKQALHYFLNVRYIPGTETLFDNIYRIPAGHILIWQNQQARLERYWQLNYQIDNQHNTAYFIEGLEYHLDQAVKRQMVSDVPLGLYLSGGMDSSSLVYFASQHSDQALDTFSLGFNEPTDELDDAQVIHQAFNTQHHAISLNPDPLHHFPQALWYAEEPKENILQGFLLARHARQFVTVALSGLGGDELFAGYKIHDFINKGSFINALIPGFLQKTVLHPLRKLMFYLDNSMGELAFNHYRRGLQLLLGSGDRSYFYRLLRNTWDDDLGQWQNIYGPAMLEASLKPMHSQFDAFFIDKKQDFLQQVLEAEFHTKMMEDFLNNEDRVSMAQGLEVRVPFLDKNLVNFSFSIPPKLKYHQGQGKYIFKQTMQNKLPEHTLRKKKWGFTFNSYHQFNKDLKQVAQRIITPQRIEAQGLFNYQYLHKIIQHKPDPKLYWHYFFLWNVVGFLIWEKMFLEGDPSQPIFDLEYYYE